MRKQQCDSEIWTNNVRVFAVAFVVGLGNPVKTPHNGTVKAYAKITYQQYWRTRN
ncbi:MAG: hypothetical protein U5N85_11145 [Arcicella sp.]|nr:hypothetical protein [Arcicella sp.]